MSLVIDVSSRIDASGRVSSVARLVGELDGRSAAQAQGSLAILAESAPHAVVFDLEKLTFLDSSGITVLLASRIAFRRRGVNVYLANLAPRVRKVLDVVQALPGVPIFRSMEEFDAYLSKVQDDEPSGGGGGVSGS